MSTSPFKVQMKNISKVDRMEILDNVSTDDLIKHLDAPYNKYSAIDLHFKAHCFSNDDVVNAISSLTKEQRVRLLDAKCREVNSSNEPKHLTK